MAKALKVGDVGGYEHYKVSAYGLDGEVWCLPERFNDAVSEILDFLAQERDKRNGYMG